MTLRLALRRIAVTAGVAACLVLGAATIRAAAVWTADNAPLDKPISVQSLANDLAIEQARSISLAERLDGVSTQAAGLRDAIGAAALQVSTDQKTADDLKARLAAAQKKLKTLNKQIAQATARLRAAAAAPAPVVRTRPAPAPAPAHEVEHDD